MHKSKHHFADGEAGSRNRYQTFRLTESEAGELVEHARSSGHSVSQLVRLRVLGQPAPVAAAPELNRAAYEELARTAANLNQLAHHLNEVRVASAAEIIDLVQVKALVQKALAEVADLRAELLGTSKK